MYFYISLQYSAIQKTVLRHDRLWSIAGTSQILSKLNEILLPDIAKNHNGQVLVAGGGKFTTRFNTKEGAEKARQEIIKSVSTTLPMLEFQVSRVVEADNFREAQEESGSGDTLYPGIIHELSETKRCFRGYGVTYNPHLKVCEECEEYPASRSKPMGKDRKPICRTCYNAREKAAINPGELKKDDESLTTIEKIYAKYVDALPDKKSLSIPLDFDDLFSVNDTANEKKRLAVWFSDLNSMNDKVTLWLKEKQEEKILGIFNSVKDTMVTIISETLAGVFKESTIITKSEENKNVKSLIPFRIIVAGGDDLCIVMPDRYVLQFAKSLFAKTKEKLNSFEDDNPLSKAWLLKKAEEAKKESEAKKKVPKKYAIQDYSFGGSFVVTSVHTPFTKIHSLGEELMRIAKNKTDRAGNSINWAILSVDETSVSHSLLHPEKPLLVELAESKSEHLTFTQYMELCKEYKTLSASHIQQMIGKIIEFKGNSKEFEKKFERWLKRLPDAARKDNPLNGLLQNPLFRKDGRFHTSRFVTLAELLLLQQGD